MTQHLLSVLFAIPWVGAFAIFFTPRQWHGALRWFALGISLLELGVSLMLLRGDYSTAAPQFVEQRFWVWNLGIAYRVGVDGISLFLVLLTTTITPIALFISWLSVTTKAKEHALAFLTLEGALVGAFLARDLFFFYVCWELVLVPVYFLVGMWGSGDRARSATKFFIYTLVGSLVMLVAIIYVGTNYAHLAGHPSFALSDLTTMVLPARAQAWLFGAFAFAFVIKMPLFPFHTWSPDTYRDAPIGTVIVLSAVMAKLGGYGLIRFAVPLFPAGCQTLAPTLAVLAVVGISYGALAAWSQRDLRVLLAYSSMSHMGFVALGIFAITESGASGAVLQMVNHGITTAGLFVVVGMIESRTGLRKVEDMGGLASAAPWFAAALVVLAMSSIGVPGTNGFVGELLVLAGTFGAEDKLGYGQYSRFFAASAALGVVLGAVYVLGAVRRIAWGPLAEGFRDRVPDVTRAEAIALVPLIALVFFLGVHPSTFLDRTQASVAALVAETRAQFARGENAEEPSLVRPAEPVAAPTADDGGDAPPDRPRPGVPRPPRPAPPSQAPAPPPAPGGHP